MFDFDTFELPHGSWSRMFNFPYMFVVGLERSAEWKAYSVDASALRSDVRRFDVLHGDSYSTVIPRRLHVLKQKYDAMLCPGKAAIRRTV